jgi:hypothetical protein
MVWEMWFGALLRGCPEIKGGLEVVLVRVILRVDSTSVLGSQTGRFGGRRV